MARFKLFLYLQFVFFSALPALAQVDTAWVRRYNGPADSTDHAFDLAVDDSGNVYVTGGSGGDYATIKYAPNGDTLWVRRYNGPGNSSDEAYSLAVDGSGNVYVTGYSRGGGTADDYATIKYSSSGDTLWVRRYNGPANVSDVATALAVDDSGNVYVTGYSPGSGTGNDYATIKYSSAGNTLWVRRYNGPGSVVDQANALKVDASGNVYVTGYSAGGVTGFDYATIKYSSFGDTLWVRRYNGPGNHSDLANDMAIDDSGNVYVTGFSAASNFLSDYATIKYSSSGETLWVRRYNSPGDGDDLAYALAVDDSGNVYVTGYSYSGTSYDYATIKYSSSGDTLWVRRYSGPGNSDDQAYALALDGSGNVYVTGRSWGSGTFDDYATIKYAPNGDTLWGRRYNGPGNDYDEARALALDTAGNVYVTGWSWGSGTFEDYATIKYLQFTCVDTAGDANGDGKVTLPDIITLVNHVFKGGPKPNPACRGDANADGKITLPDIITEVNYVFKGGPKPLKSRECCL